MDVTLLPPLIKVQKTRMTEGAVGGKSDRRLHLSKKASHRTDSVV